MTLPQLLVVGVLLGMLPAYIADRNGRSFVGWWLFGAAALIIALPASVLVGPHPTKRRYCPWCRSSVDTTARICPHCTRDIYEALAAGRS